ncbi:MAG: heme exporter protein CcmB [Fimbriimonadaceae bacterium]|nr:MAG: heme exporter protein CcmB [Fimbriimonadaceae bacterium]
MSSFFSPQVKACLIKEWRVEARSRQGLFVSALFGFMALAAVNFSTMISVPLPGLAAGLLAVILIFVATVAVPRIFLAEDEQGTFDLVRQWGASGPVFLGKALFGAIFQGAAGFILGLFYSGMIGVPVVNWPLFLVMSTLLGIASSNVLCLTSTMVMTASNRWVLASVVGLPLLFPLIFLGIGGLKVSFGDGGMEGAYQSIAALVGYAVVPLGLGPMVAQSLWTERRDPGQKPGLPQNKDRL